MSLFSSWYDFEHNERCFNTDKIVKHTPAGALNMTGFKQLVKLVKRFTSSPSNPYEPQNIAITFGEARIVYKTRPSDLTPSGYIDRGLYARLMLDAATLAAGSMVEDFEVANDSFSMYGMNETPDGTITAIARLTHTDENRYTVETRLLDADQNAISSGYGTFSVSEISLDEVQDTEAEDVQDDTADAPEPQIAYGTIWRSPMGMMHLN